MGSLQKKDTKCERAKLIPFQSQLEQKHSGTNILTSRGGQNQCSHLCGVVLIGLPVHSYPNSCKDGTLCFCSPEVPWGMLELKHSEHLMPTALKRDRVGEDADSMSYLQWWLKFECVRMYISTQTSLTVTAHISMGCFPRWSRKH